MLVNKYLICVRKNKTKQKTKTKQAYIQIKVLFLLEEVIYVLSNILLDPTTQELYFISVMEALLQGNKIKMVIFYLL